MKVKVLGSIILLVVMFSVTACGVSFTNTSTPTPTSSEASLTAEEVGVIDDVVALLPDLEHIYSQEIVAMDTGSLSVMSDYADDWVIFADEWKATNDGKLAGGKVARLEILFEHASDLVRSYGKVIVSALAGTATDAEISQGASDGVAAESAIQDVKDEVNMLRSEASF